MGTDPRRSLLCSTSGGGRIFVCGFVAYCAGVGILGANPSSRVRMFMNSSPVMVSFFWR